MATDPRTSARYPVSTNVPNVAQDIQNGVNDLSDTTVPRYASAAARDTAHSNWVAAGNTMDNGLLCTVSGELQVYRGSWQAALPTKYRRIAATASGTLAGGATVNICASQTVQSLFGTSVNYMVDVDATYQSSVPAGLGVLLEILVDGVVQDGENFTNGGSSMTFTSRVRCGATFADNSSHSITARLTALAGTITGSTTNGRMILMARPYLAF